MDDFRIDWVSFAPKMFSEYEQLPEMLSSKKQK